MEPGRARAADGSIGVAQRTNTMPLLPEDQVSWLPVDLCGTAGAQAGLEILGSSDRGEQAVFNVNNPTRISPWRGDFLPASVAAGVDWQGVAPHEWVDNLKDYAKTYGDEAAEKNLAVKLLDFSERLYGGSSGGAATRSMNVVNSQRSWLVFDSTKA